MAYKLKNDFRVEDSLESESPSPVKVTDSSLSASPKKKKLGSPPKKNANYVEP